jgi:hypothetical protein
MREWSFMPRQVRQKSERGIYHVLLRGINGHTVFEDEEDHVKYLLGVKECKEKSGFKLMADYIMGNYLR